MDTRNSGRTRASAALVAAITGLGLAACGPGPNLDASEAESGPPELAIFVYDRSASISDYQLELARQLTRQRITALSHGDRIAAVQVLQLSLEEPPQRWSQDVPKREWEGMDVARDSITLARFQRDADAYLRTFTDASDREEIMGTDLLSTFHDVAAEVGPFRDYRTAVYLFSDMLQSGREIEMEGLRRMPAEDWVETRRASARLPDLDGICVVVIGARIDTDASQNVKSFWSEYFKATGANLYDHNYSLRPVSLPLDPCPGV
jgi:hypothetical protein